MVSLRSDLSYEAFYKTRAKLREEEKKKKTKNERSKVKTTKNRRRLRLVNSIFYNEAKKRILSESARRTIEPRYIRTNTKRTFDRRQYANENFKLEASLPVNTFYRRYVVNILWKNSPRTTDKLPKPEMFPVEDFFVEGFYPLKTFSRRRLFPSKIFSSKVFPVDFPVDSR